MTWWCWTHLQDDYEMVVVFANTGQENEETLLFIKRFESHYGIPVVWIEAVVHHGKRKSNTANIVTFETADRNGVVFEEIIKKHGIPNRNTPHCTRELKQNPIKNFAKSLGWTKWFTAIGIRRDEIWRKNEKSEDLRLIYPLIDKAMKPMTKPMINFWWSQQPFRLNLKGYQGNCKACWKKSDAKLFTIAKETPAAFDFTISMEHKYGNFIPPNRLKKMQSTGKIVDLPVKFFRQNRDTYQIFKDAQNWQGSVSDDAQAFNWTAQKEIDFDLDGESCDVYSSCKN